MPNLMMNVLSQTSTYRLIQGIRDDAMSLKIQLMGGAKNASDYMSRIQASNPEVRRLTDWFDSKINSGTPSSIDQDRDDEFDPGYQTESDTTADQAMILDAKSMKNIGSAQVAEMANVAKKQTEAKRASTVEIMKTIDDRSMDVMASLKTTSTLTSNILSKMNIFLSMQMSEAERIRKAEQSFINANGRITIQSIKEYMNGTMTGISNGLAAGILQATGLNQIDEAFADKIMNVQTSFFEKLFDTKLIKKLTGGLNDRRTANRDYSTEITTRFDRNPAVFDNITRQSIVKTIPKYLQQITQFLTGHRFNVSNRGELTTETNHTFGKLASSTLNIGQMKEEIFSPISTKMKSIDSEFNDADIKEAHRVIVSQYVLMMYQNGKKYLPAKAFEHGGSPNIMKKVIRLLVQTKGKDQTYWGHMISEIRSQLQLNKTYRSQLANTINATADRLHKEAVRYASQSDGAERLQFTEEMFDQAAIERLSVESSKFEHDGKTLRQLIKEKVIDRASLTADQMKRLDEPIHGFADFQYQMRQMDAANISSILDTVSMPKFKQVKQLFTMLNRGINVYFASGIMSDYHIDESQLPSSSQKQQQPTVVYPEESYMIPMNPNGTPKSSPLDAMKGFVSSVGSKIKGLFGKKESGDSERAAEVLASMKAAAQSGDISEEESAALTAKTAEIKDPKQRSAISRAVEGVKARSKNKSGSKSMLGRALFFVLGTAKTFVSTLLSKAKTFLLNNAKWMANQLVKGLKTTLSGLKHVGAGFVGLGKDVAGGVSRVTSFVKGVASNIKDKAADKIEQTREKARKKRVERILNEMRLNQAAEVQQATDINMAEAETTDFQQEVEEEAAAQAVAKSGIFDSIKNKIKNSAFGQGFMSAFKKNETKVAKTLEDQSSKTIDDLVNSSSPKTSFLNTAANILDKIADMFDTRAERKRQKEAAKEKGESTTSGKKKGIGFDLGKIAGGFTKALMGIMQSVGAIITGMTGFKALMEIPKQILEKSLKPLNKVFQALVVALKPVVKAVQKAMTIWIEYIVALSESIIKIMQPILEAIGPIIEQLMGVLKPILDMLTDLINVLLVPLMAVIISVGIPVLKTIANTLSIQLGIIQVGFGLVLTTLGAILTGVGMIGKLFGARSLYDTGKGMMDTGTSMLKSGFSSIKTGAQGMLNTVTDTAKALTGKTEEKKEEKTEEKKTTVLDPSKIPNSIGSPMDGMTGSGDEDTFQFSDDVKKAYKNLKSIVGNIFSAFDMSEDDTTEDRLEQATTENSYSQAKIDVESSNLSDDDKAAIDTDAFDLFKKDHPKYEGESDKEYQKRYEDSKSKYWTIAATKKLSDAINGTPGGNINSAKAFIDTSLATDTDGNVTALKGFTDTMLNADNEIQQGSAAQSIAQSMAAMNGSRSASTTGYDITDLINAVAKVYSAYADAYPNVPYSNDYTAGRQITVNGKKRGLRPDCSGIISAAIQTMGYRLKGANDAGRDSHSFAGANSNTFIMDPDGELSSDWEVLPFSVSALQRGDITARPGHVSMPITNLRADWPKGFDGGNSTNTGGDHIPKSAKAAKAYLAGDKNWESYLPSAMGPKWNSSGGATKIWRFVGHPAPVAGNYNGDGTKMNAGELYKYLVHQLGMSQKGAAGMLGIFHYESDMRSNNLEDAYEKKLGNDKEYTARVDSGAETEKQFITGRGLIRFSGQKSGEAVGYGLSQFTSSSLKKDLYNRTVKRGKSISDAPSQLDMLADQMKKMQYKGTSLFQAIANAETPTEANKYFLWRYAAGTSFTSDAAVLKKYKWMSQRNLDDRHSMAEKYYQQLRGSGDEPITQEAPTVNLEYVTSVFDLNAALDKLTQNTLNVESISIKSLVSDIFAELPEYLEDDEDEDDIYDEEAVYM